jgi:mannosyltransferase
MGGRAEDAVKNGVLLAAVIILAAFLRFDGLGVPSYWLDEILHQYLTTNAAAQPWWRWIIGFSPEHGPLYYASQLVARPFGSSETAGRFPAALFGLVTVPLVWLASCGTGSPTRPDGLESPSHMWPRT